MIVHPKLIRLKEMIIQRFGKCEMDADQQRIVIVCPVRTAIQYSTALVEFRILIFDSILLQFDAVVEEIDRIFRNLPDAIRYHCIKTKAKCLANEPDHKVRIITFGNW